MRDWISFERVIVTYWVGVLSLVLMDVLKIAHQVAVALHVKIVLGLAQVAAHNLVLRDVLPTHVLLVFLLVLML